jgi:pyruvate formate lyase activating enzyme
VRGIVFHIQRFSIHDGPGIRTTIFLKGCSNVCDWCHNPESIRRAPEIQVYPDKCIACGACVEVCPEGAQEMRDGLHLYHRERCQACGACVRECFAGAMTLAGREMSVEEVLEETLKDQDYYLQSQGGVTLSGGEPVLQTDFAEAILRRCRQENLHTAIETAGNYPYPWLERLLPHLNLVMYDLKAFSPEIHLRHIGNDGSRIRENLRRLADAALPLIVRTPVVGGVNDTPEEIAGIAALIGDYPCLLYYELLPYHNLHTGKFASLDRKYTGGFTTPSRQQMSELAEAARRYVREVRP